MELNEYSRVDWELFVSFIRTEPESSAQSLIIITEIPYIHYISYRKQSNTISVALFLDNDFFLVRIFLRIFLVHSVNSLVVVVNGSWGNWNRLAFSEMLEVKRLSISEWYFDKKLSTKWGCHKDSQLFSCYAEFWYSMTATEEQQHSLQWNDNWIERFYATKRGYTLQFEPCSMFNISHVA